MSLRIVRDDELTPTTFAREWIGGDTPACVIFVDAKPGDSVALHRHTYAELFFVLEGTATFDDGETTVDVEAQAFVVAAGQFGTHPGARQTYGHSLVVDPWGTVIAEASDGVGVWTATLERARLEGVRRSLPSLAHRVLF